MLHSAADEKKRLKRDISGELQSCRDELRVVCFSAWWRMRGWHVLTDVQYA
jgi:hypothetical protein